MLSGESSLSGDWFIGYLVVFSQIIPPARSLSDGYFRVTKGAASVERLHALFDLETNHQEIKQTYGAEPPTLFKEIVFQDVVYRYPGQDVPALNKLNLVIPSGKVIALVGSSGSGKTTATHLLCKFADPNLAPSRWMDMISWRCQGRRGGITWRS